MMGFACSQANAKADARPKELPAKGEKQCSIHQLSSEYLEAQHAEVKAKAGVSFYMKTSSYFAFRVLKSGAVMVGMTEDTYPGSRIYFMIDGRRYTGPAGYYLNLDTAALAALKQEKLIDFTYTIWPDRNEVSRKDIFSGFTKAYDECRSFLSGKPK